MSELKGTVEKVFETETFASGFQKRTLVVNTGGEYAQYIPIEFFKDKIDLLDGLKVGDDVTVHTNLRGRKWESPQGEVKYFPSVEGWKIESGSKSTPKKETKSFAEETELDDTLPF